MSIYKVLFPTSILSSAMLVSRGVSFYLFVLISGSFILYFTFLRKEPWHKK